MHFGRRSVHGHASAPRPFTRRLGVALVLGTLLASSLPWVAASAASGIDLELPAGRTISGTVVGPDGSPLSGVSLSACETPAPAGAECRRGGTNWEGAFAIGGLREASHVVQVSPPGWPDESGVLPDVAGGWYWNGGITADQTAATSISTVSGDATIEVTLPAGGHIAGTVTSADGGVPDITVHACTVPQGACSSALTDASGAYDLPALESGSYRLRVELFGVDLMSGWVSGGSIVADEVDAQAYAVELGAVTGVDVLLPAGRHISGVVSGPDGPVADAQVSACAMPDGYPCHSTTTGADGSYEIVGLGGGSFGLRVIDWSGALPVAFYTEAGVSGNWKSASPVDVSTGDVAGLDIAIPRGGMIRGTVTNPDVLGGGPVEFVSMEACLDTCNDAQFYAETDASGAYAIGPLLPGTYFVGASAFGEVLGGYYTAGGLVNHESIADPVSVADGSDSVVDMQLLDAYAITGTLIGADGTPLPAGDGLMACVEGTDLCMPASGDEGSFRIGSLRAETYELRYDPQFGSAFLAGWYSTDGWSRTQAGATGFSLSGGSDATVDIVVPAGETMEGIVTGEEHGPLANAFVSVCASAEDCERAQTGEDGSYAIGGLWPDEYIVQAQTEPEFMFGRFLTGWYATGGTVTDASLASPVVVGDVPGGTGNTAPGSNVNVSPVDPSTGSAPVSVTFSTVTAQGDTTLGIASTGPTAPSHYRFTDPATYLTLGTTAGFTGPVEVCVDYSSQTWEGDESFLRLIRTSSSSWVDVTSSHDPATDRLCGTTTLLGTFAVAVEEYFFLGFQPPIARPPAVNSAKAGAKVDLRFSIEGEQGLDVLAASPAVSRQVDCATGAGLGPESAADITLLYQADVNRYVARWRTEKSWAGQCREFVLTTRDGADHPALFRFRL